MRHNVLPKGLYVQLGRLPGADWSLLKTPDQVALIVGSPAPKPWDFPLIARKGKSAMNGAQFSRGTAQQTAQDMVTLGTRASGEGSGGKAAWGSVWYQ